METTYGQKLGEFLELLLLSLETMWQESMIIKNATAGPS